jgi:hypothetical protein
MLQNSQTPDDDTNWSIQVQSTPGVIGAQEVYRLVILYSQNVKI